MQTSPSIQRLDDAQVRLANLIYDELGFVPSRRASSHGAGDETFGVLSPPSAGASASPIALGRIDHHDDGALEIGGFWTHPDHRRRGLARRLVEHVIENLPHGRVVYCVPFDHLVDFYTSFGLRRVAADEVLPASISAKQAFCRKQSCRGVHEQTRVLELRT